MVMDKNWRLKLQQEVDKTKEQIQAILNDDDLLDEDGYPTDGALKIIEMWHWTDVAGWFAFIKSIWHLRSWGWTEGEDIDHWSGERMYLYQISTAGWSGNESIIHAMKQNHMLWAVTWVQSRRGGHYIFTGKEIPDVEEETNNASDGAEGTDGTGEATC